MKTLQEFENMGVTKNDILYGLSSRLYYDREWDNLSDSEFIECTTDMLSLKFDNTLKGTALTMAREILSSLYPNSDTHSDMHQRLKALRKANLFKCAQALVDAGYLESNPVPPRRRRRVRRRTVR
jgi:hypothetical protein